MAAGVLDDVVDGEEVGREAELGDQRQLVADLGLDLGRELVRIVAFGAGPGAVRQLLVGRAAIIAVLDRIVVGELLQREAAALQDLDAAL